MIYAPEAIVFFFAINLTTADSVDGHLIRTKNLKDCQHLQQTYDKAMTQYNLENSQAFQVRWSTKCEVMIVGDGVKS